VSDGATDRAIDHATRYLQRVTSGAALSGTLRAVPDQTTLSTLRGQLDDERGRLAAQISSLEVGRDESPAYDDNFADSGQVAAEQGENKALLNQLNEQLDEVDHALAKMDDGTYGVCEVCGTAIAEARLEAMPATRFCIAHA
jgi:RNA polymerase-binding transcription factor DksA